MNNNLVGIPGIAKLTGLTPGTVKGYRTAGKLPPPDVTLGPTKRWKKSTIIEWNEQRTKRYDNRKSNT